MGACAACALLSLTLFAHASAEARRSNFPPELDESYLPSPSVLRLLSLGHSEALADLLWVDGLSRYGEEITRGGDMSWLDRYFGAISSLDPSFKQAYLWCGVAAIYNHNVITTRSVERSTRCLELGARAFPQEWLFPFEIGSNYLNELHTANAVQRTRWRLLGASYIEEASLLPGSPPWLPSVAAHVYTREGQREIAVRELEQALSTTQDSAERKALEDQLSQLRPQEEVDRLAQATRELERQWQETAPYLPADLFVLVGASPPATVDLRRLGEDSLPSGDDFRHASTQDCNPSSTPTCDSPTASNGSSLR